MIFPASFNPRAPVCLLLQAIGALRSLQLFDAAVAQPLYANLHGGVATSYQRAAWIFDPALALIMAEYEHGFLSILGEVHRRALAACRT